MRNTQRNLSESSTGSEEPLANVRALDVAVHDVDREDFSLQAYVDQWMEARRNGHVIPDEKIGPALKQARAGDISARVQFVEAMTGYAAYVATDYQDEGVTDRELIAAGRDVVNQLLETYEPRRGRNIVDFAVGEFLETYEARLAAAPEPAAPSQGLLSVVELPADPEMPPSDEPDESDDAVDLKPEVDAVEPAEPEELVADTSPVLESDPEAEPQLEQEASNGRKRRELRFRLVERDGEEAVFDLETNQVVTFASIARADRAFEGKEIYLPDEVSPSERSMYLQLTHHRVLTEAEEQFLGRQYMAGDQTAKKLLTEHNYRLVASVAVRHYRHALTFTDRFQEGLTGLNRAIEKFDPDRNFKLSTYAVNWIKQAISRAAENQDRTIRLPSHMEVKYGRMLRAETKFRTQYDREPTVEELSETAGVTESEIFAIRQAVACGSLDVPVGDDTELTLGEIQADPEAEGDFRRLVDGISIEGLLDLLSVRTREVVARRFGLDGHPAETLEQIGERFGFSRERARQIEQQGLETLMVKVGVPVPKKPRRKPASKKVSKK